MSVAVGQALLLRQIAEILLDLLLKAGQLLDRFRIGELGQFIQINDGQLSSLFGFFQLFEQLFDLLQFFQNFQRSRDAQFFASGEVPVRGKKLNLVFVAE